MNDKPKKKANQLKNQEVAERLFPPEVIDRAKEVANEKDTISAPKGRSK